MYEQHLLKTIAIKEEELATGIKSNKPSQQTTIENLETEGAKPDNYDLNLYDFCTDEAKEALLSAGNLA